MRRSNYARSPSSFVNQRLKMLLAAGKRVCSAWGYGPLQARALQTSARALMPDVLVPPLGESVSEGTISSILVQPGAQVNVDSVVAQLETDKVRHHAVADDVEMLRGLKDQQSPCSRPRQNSREPCAISRHLQVTIDCKSPVAGVLQKLLVRGQGIGPFSRAGRLCGRMNHLAQALRRACLLLFGMAQGSEPPRSHPVPGLAGSCPVQVKVGDTVKPGTPICSVGDGAGVSAAAAPPPQPAASSSGSTSAGAQSSSGRKPSIKFPPRVAPDGRRISDLPEAEAASVLQALSAAASSVQGSGAPAAAAPAPKPAAPAASAPASAPAAAPAPKAGKVVLPSDAAPPRLKPTRLELDMINLGGAMP